MLRDSLRELGLDQAIAEAAEAIPDARDRLYYVVQMTAQAAERALNSVEASQPHQDQMEKSAKALTQRWDDWFADPIDLADARELVTDTRQFLADVPAHTSFTNAQLLEIMMAQDFQDLTGQVIKRMMDVIQEIERQLLMVLLENIPGVEFYSNLGLTYLDNPGMIVRSGEQKYSINLKLISDVTNWLQLGAQVWGTHSDRDRNNVDALSSWEFLKTVPGIYPYYDGKFGGIETSVEDGAAHNPMQLLNGDGDSYYKTTHAYSTAYAQVKFLKDFTFKSTFGYDYYNARHKYTDGQNESYSFSRNEVVASPAALEALSSYMYYHHYYNWKITNTLNWAHTFAQKHDVGALVGFEEGKNSDGNTDVKKMGMIDATLTDLNTLTSEEYTRGNFTGYTYRSWFGRLNYAYDSRYLLEANFRYDGSSRFSPDNRWGFFPSASAGWRLDALRLIVVTHQ